MMTLPFADASTAVGRRLGVNADTVKNHLGRARREFREAVVGVVSEYVDNEKDFTLEIGALIGS